MNTMLFAASDIPFHLVPPCASALEETDALKGDPAQLRLPLPESPLGGLFASPAKPEKKPAASDHSKLPACGTPERDALAQETGGNRFPGSRTNYDNFA